MYVFGGRTIGPDSSQTVYSGLYQYNITLNKWRLLRTDFSQPENSIHLKSRIGHSMLLNPLTRELYVFAGQRNKDYLSDFYVYEIDNDVVHEISRDYSKQGGPDAGFTQRATIDTETGEFFVLSGLQKDKNTTQESVKNSFWSYSIKRGKWNRVYYNENVGAEYWAQMKDKEPCPRFAHQLVYDQNRKVHFLFGGNPGDSTNLNLRLDDFWELKLTRPTASDILRRAIFHVRKQEFKELCISGDSTTALTFLQNNVAQVVDHNDEKESKEFRALAMHLFQWKTAIVPPKRFVGQQAVGGLVSNDIPKDLFLSRTELYETVLEYFPASLREPKSNLVDLIDLVPGLV